jgi:hypothetical protein
MPEFLSEDLPSWRPWYLVGEEHFPNFLVWSNLHGKKKKGLKCEKHDIDSSSNIICLRYQKKNLLGNIIDNMLRRKYTSNFLYHKCHWNLPNFFIFGTDNMENDVTLEVIFKENNIMNCQVFIYLRCNSSINYFRMQN